ncbi:MFS transporter [Natronosporangium hydrolyticum]|uniref:MFS transporter n=1 Tax=Natronosporangium hydrolyticum TaxID=2811111 RepID=A0A895YI25_9ACTN|nr:MFS transporter [Natronosporangium hydrolyticum]QSB14216.1 MFS transporter [Natronosporangium hydrolyticum]
MGSAGLLALVATYGIGRQAYGLFVPTFRQEFSLSLDVLGFYASAAQAGYLVATVVTGVLTARFGPRVPVVAGCLLLAVGAAVAASAPGPVLLAVGIIAAGTSAGGAWAPFSDAVSNQVPLSGSRRALALVNAGSPVGLVVASGLVLVAGDQWRAAWWGFAVIGLVAAAVAWRVLSPAGAGPAVASPRPRIGWFFHTRSVRLFVVTVGVSITSGAFFAYAPDTAQADGLGSWIGPAMWAALGVAGAAVGVFGGGIADRYGLRRPLAVALVMVGASTLLLLVAPGSVAAALGSAALFGIGFTTGFAFVVMWSQQVFHDRPTTGFTLVIIFIAAGFIIGPSLFGVLATYVGRPEALLAAAVPALLVALVPPAAEDRFRA